MLRRLAVFVGHFTLDAALEVVTSATLDKSNVLGAVDSLVAKSLVATSPLGAMMRYRLLDTTRAYALEINIDDADATRPVDTACGVLSSVVGAEREGMVEPSSGIERASHFAGMNNVRAALEWCFCPDGNTEVGSVLQPLRCRFF